MRKTSDIALLEGLINRYGKNTVINFVNSLNENFGSRINGYQRTTIEDYENSWNVDFQINYLNFENHRCIFYIWLRDGMTIDNIPEVLLEDGVVFERRGIYYWLEPDKNNSFITYNGTCISLSGFLFAD